MDSTINERIKSIVKNSGMSVRAYAELAKIPQTTLNDCIKGLTEPKFGLIEKIISVEPNINIDWLLTGRGESLDAKNKLYGVSETSKWVPGEPEAPYFVNKSGVEYFDMPNGKYRMRVPLVPVKAYAKYLDECRDAELVDDLEKMEFVVDKIGLGRYYAFEIKGDSMDDNSKRSICDNDIVLARELSKDHWRSKLHNDDYPFWIIVLHNTILCKQITHHDVENAEITCHSINPSPEYSDFKLNLNDVCQLCNIVLKQSNSF